MLCCVYSLCVLVIVVWGCVRLAVNCAFAGRREEGLPHTAGGYGLVSLRRGACFDGSHHVLLLYVMRADTNGLMGEREQTDKRVVHDQMKKEKRGWTLN